MPTLILFSNLLTSLFLSFLECWGRKCHKNKSVDCVSIINCLAQHYRSAIGFSDYPAFNSVFDHFTVHHALTRKLHQGPLKVFTKQKAVINSLPFFKMNQSSMQLTSSFFSFKTGLNASLPPPSFLSPHSKLQLSGSLAEQLIPQAALSTQNREWLVQLITLLRVFDQRMV